MNPDTIFVHDNAPIHTVRKVKGYLQEIAFQVLNWPPYSPYLNPIKNIWKLLKQGIYEKYPKPATFSSSSESLQKLVDAAIELWEEIGVEMGNRVVDSMPRRIEAVLAAHGWYTKY